MVTPKEFRALPFVYSSAFAREVLAIYRIWDSDRPSPLKTNGGLHGMILKSTKEFYCALNDHSTELAQVADAICIHSILVDGFNARYAKMYKYVRQAFFGHAWNIPDDPPNVPELGKEFSSWASVVAFLKSTQPHTVELLIPPALLFPWKDALPEDIEYLDAEPVACTLDMTRITNIVRSCLQAPTMLPTKFDFAIAHTNTHVCAADIPKWKLPTLERKAMTNKKYVEVTNWLDKGCPPHNKYAIRTPVWKAPAEYRDAVSCTPALLYDSWRLNSTLKYAWSPKISKMIGDYTDPAIMADLRKKHPLFIMTDWKKSGLTMPKWFCKLVVSELNKVIPHGYEVNDLDFEIYDPVKKRWFYNKDFGFGLGLVNNLFTLFNIVLFLYAQEEGVFSQNDKMLSFNDDSVIGCQKSAYNRWVLICRQSGGWLDVHKTFSSLKGCVFVEIHMFDRKINYKWVSTYKTLLSSLYKASNWDHWRFLISDMWDSVRVEHYTGELNNVIADPCANYINKIAEQFWGRTSNFDLVPELGGVSLGVSSRTWLSLKKALVQAEELNVVQALVPLQMLKAWKIAISKPLIYRPWKKFPKGRTAASFTVLGKMEGLNHELAVCADKVRNKFNMDTEFLNEQLWIPLGKQFEEIRSKPMLENNFWSWAKTVRWGGYALPDAFVLETQPCPTMKSLPFARLQKEKPAWSLPSMLVAYIEEQEKPRPIFPVVPYSEIDFSKYTQYEAPLRTDISGWGMLGDMRYLGALAEFADPRMVLLDYANRTKNLALSLDLPDRRGPAALNLMRKAYNCEFRGYTWATWYTPIPCPVKEEWGSILASNIPMFHPEILVLLDEGHTVEETTAYVSLREVEVFRHANPSWWREATGTRKRNVRRRKDVTGHTTKESQTPDESDVMVTITMDDITKMFEQIATERSKPAPEPEPENLEMAWDFPEVELEELHPAESGSDPDNDYEGWDPNAEEDEESILAAYQDRINLPWDTET